MLMWVIGGGTGLLGLLGLLVTAHSPDGVTRGMGTALFVLACLFIFVMVKDEFDRREGYGLPAERLARHEARWNALKDALGIWLLAVGASILGLVGLIGAAHSEGGLHLMGLGLFVLAVLLDFVLIKQRFDRAERE